MRPALREVLLDDGQVDETSAKRGEPAQNRMTTCPPGSPAAAEKRSGASPSVRLLQDADTGLRADRDLTETDPLGRMIRPLPSRAGVGPEAT